MASKELVGAPGEHIPDLDVGYVVDGTEYMHMVDRNGNSRRITALEVAALASASSATAEFIRDTIGAALIAAGILTAFVDDAGNTITLSVTTEAVQDVIGALIAGSTGITATYDDAGNVETLTLNTEAVQDIVGAFITGANGIAATYDDAGNLETISIVPSIQAVASNATVTPTFADDMVKITAQAANLTLANPTGTAIAGKGIVLRIKDNGTARTITYGTKYRPVGVVLPTTTIVNKTLYLGMIYNSDDDKWDVVALRQEA